MKKILVPIDGSSVSEKTVEKAVEIAKMYGSSITFVHIVNVPDTYRFSRHVGYMELNIKSMTDNMKKNGQEMLESVVGNIDCNKLDCEKIVVVGQPEEEILRFASDGNFDLIIMGRRGYSKIKRFFVGSVTQRVISDSTCPVLVVNE